MIALIFAVMVIAVNLINARKEIDGKLHNALMAELGGYQQV